MFDLITNRCELVRDGTPEKNPEAFQVANDSQEKIQLPDNLIFINEIIDYFRMIPNVYQATQDVSKLDEEWSAVSVNRGYEDAYKLGGITKQIRRLFLMLVDMPF